MKRILIICLSVCTMFDAFTQNIDASANLEVPKSKKSKGKLPNSLVNIDFGYGFDRLASRLPVKLVIGSGNNGIVVGFQRGGIQEVEMPGNRISDGSSAQQIPSFYTYNGATYLESTISDYEEPRKGIILKLGYQKSIVRGLYTNITIDVCRSKRTYDFEHSYNAYYSYFNGSFTNNYIKKTTEVDYVSEAKWGVRANLGLGYTLSFTKSKRVYFNFEFIYSVLNRSKMEMAPVQVHYGIGFRLGKPASTTIEGMKSVNTIPVKAN